MADQVIRIERKTATLEETAERLRQALLAADRPDVTPADATAVSGLPLAACQEALFHLATTYPARIQVSETGTLRFSFTTLAPTAPSWPERVIGFCTRHAEALKTCALMMLVPPFLLTVAAHCAALADVPSQAGSLLAAAPMLVTLPVQLVAWVFAAVVGFAGMGALFQLQLLPLIGFTFVGYALFEFVPAFLRDPGAWFWEFLPYPVLILFFLGSGACSLFGSWLLYRHYIFGTRSLMARGLWRHVGGLLFGPGRTRADDLADERRLTALIVQREGILCNSDLMALFGWTPEEADEQLSRVLLDYGGDVMVTEEGAVLYHFDHLTLAAGSAPVADLRPAYEREGPYPAFWSAPPLFARAFSLLVVMGLAGLLLHPKLIWFPSLALWGPHGLIAMITGDRLAVMQALGLYPYLLILVPVLLRVPFYRRGRAAHAERARFLKVLKLAIAHADGKYVRRIPEAEVARLGGDLDVTRTRPDGKLWLHFPRLAAAQRAADRVRRELAARPASAEAIAYDTGGS